MSPRRVLMISSLWPPIVLGGAESYAASLAEHLRARGDEVGVLTLGVPGPDVVGEVHAWPYRLDQYVSAGAARRAAFHLLDIYRPATLRAARATIREFQPDVLHTHAVAGLSSAVLALPGRQGVGHVHTLHDYWLLCRRATLVKRSGADCASRCVTCRLVSGARNRIVARHPPDVVLAVSHAVAAEHADIGWLADRVRVVPNPVVPVKAPRTDRGATGPVFGFLGRLTKEKGAPTLVAAFEAASLPASARLVIGGDGPLREVLGRAAGDRIELLGWLDAPARETFFEQVDCLVVPSEWKDPAPLVVNEARARGIPVIGARIGGIPELIAPSCEPLLFRAGDVAALADRLLRFATAPETFAPDDGTGLLGWEEHLDLVTGAYDAASRMARSAREG